MSRTFFYLLVLLGQFHFRWLKMMFYKIFKLFFQEEYDLDDFDWGDEEEDSGKDEL